MTSAVGARVGGARTLSTGVPWLVALAVLMALTIWAATAGQDGEAAVEHPSPGTVETVEGSEFSIVSMSPGGAERIGLQVVRVQPASHPSGVLAVPYASLIHGADGTVWVYATAGEPLRFQRQEVRVATVVGARAILSHGPSAGTSVAGTGAAELYGTEFEVGH